MITKERLNEFIASAYKTACEHGFHDKEKSNAHYMMLVVSEVGEMVEADRKGLKADVSGFDCRMIDGFSYMTAFEATIKSSLEDETADVCIRLFDFLGMKGIQPDTFEEKKDDWQNMFASLSVCEQCYELVQGITLIGNDSTPNEIAEIAGAMILFCFDFAKEHGFDLEQHIVWKMKYNNLRAKLHGKNY
jgi:NTP pyrophosphatase (non-canonical NTP hydrolase)